jgi:hypothetical protein
MKDVAFLELSVGTDSLIGFEQILATNQVPAGVRSSSISKSTTIEQL